MTMLLMVMMLWCDRMWRGVEMRQIDDCVDQSGGQIALSMMVFL